MVDTRVYTAFNFLVEIKVEGVGDPICNAAFSECDGLEISIEPKTFQEGGNNTAQVHLAGAATYAQLTLKRGMSNDFGLWRWFNEVLKTEKRGLRASATIVMLGADREPQLTFKLEGCLPVKLRAPALNASQGTVAIEEMQLVYSRMDVEFPKSSTGSGASGISANVEARVGFGG
jgi:phage tail-like protein